MRTWWYGWREEIKHWIPFPHRTRERELEQRLELLLSAPPALPRLNPEEQSMIGWITEQVQRSNRNNVTRTQAYLNLYEEHPELHWAYLAHMVSRNGGWKMTDLKGDFFAPLFSLREARNFFLFLERSNWLIFQDAYPQLLVYHVSKKTNTPLFHLLPHFSVSVFMQAMWPWFWENRNSQLLTHALIVNEQHYIEPRIVTHPYFREKVFQSIKYQAQALFHLNHILFPYTREDEHPGLAGTIVQDFLDVHDRIAVGQHLYAILFQTPGIHAHIWAWVSQTPHTGSRADYWPHLFTPQRPQNKLTGEKQKEAQVHAHASFVYSPHLVQAWPDYKEHPAPGDEDWCTSTEALHPLFREVSPEPYDIADEYVFMLNKLELLNNWLN
ncbi:hypothetical protein J2S00_003438 [Caldalkalibacillus uzonensis]|uniref:DUF2515 domain-containing protein n=1 Tax=Caldalkalibacillus uzonensis TaxID=353224 RepID=A0ABU0CW17_9BACI|nr:DUF2515 family protein [Caldalkalibacillus uzonensis]MDQ0340614.1 hypothetical protein [Caldalkalibacillus uzonensis]